MSQEIVKPKENQSVIKNALSMSMGTMISRMLGFVRDLVLAALFSRTVTDVFVVAFRLPNLFRRLFGEGALSVSFIPIYIETREKKGEEFAMELSSLILTVLLVVTSSLSAVGVWFMPDILKVLVSGEGFISISGKFDLTVKMARVMFAYLFLVTSYGYLMAICQAGRKFFLSALAPALFNLTLIIFMFFPGEWFGFSGSSLAVGVLAGGVTQVLVVILQLKSLKLLPRLRWRGLSPEAKKVFQNMVPGLVGLGVLQIMTLINVNFASRLGEGTHSYMYWGDRILELPQSLIAISVGSALLPALSSLWANGESEKANEELFRHIRFMLFLAIPCAAGMYALGLPIVEVLFKRGEFTGKDALYTSYVVQIYSVLLIVSSFVKVFVTGFYAKKNTWYPATAAVLTVVFHIFVANYMTNEYGLQGLVGATVFSATFNMLTLLVGFYFLVGSFSVVKVFLMPLHFLPAAFIMGVFVYYSNGFLMSLLGMSSMSKVVSLFSTIFLGIMVYFAFSKLFKVNEVALLSRKK